jgi:menaquinone-specific isochorismate synthase
MPFFVSREQIPGKKTWERIIRQALKNIQSRKYEKIVLARETHLEFEQELNPFQIFVRLKTSNPDSIHFCIQPHNGTAFLGGTPELLYIRDANRIYSEAIAGTRRRGTDEMDDSIMETELLNSQKDRNEHWFVIQKIREILHGFCEKVENGADVSVLKLASVQHLLTHIHGILKAGVHDGEILLGLHPTPAVGGYPTEEALRDITDLEPFRRGWYAAPVGWIARDSAQFAVAIRSGLMHEKNLFLYSGAGIVTGSDPHLEWEEIDTKIANFLRALDINGHIKTRYRALTSAEQNYL